jgi:hypothetical protein
VNEPRNPTTVTEAIARTRRHLEEARGFAAEVLSPHRPTARAGEASAAWRYFATRGGGR